MRTSRKTDHGERVWRARRGQRAKRPLGGQEVCDRVRTPHCMTCTAWARGGTLRRAGAVYSYVRGGRGSGRPEARGSGICDLATRESHEGGGGEEPACGDVWGDGGRDKMQHKTKQA